MILLTAALALTLGAFIGLSFVVGYNLGRKAERARTIWLFDCALCLVSSGALHKVRRAIRGESTREQMQQELLREAEHRAEKRRRVGGAIT